MEEKGAFYTGVISHLVKREYKQSLTEDFTEKYGCNLLVYYRVCENRESAILEEKRIKGGLEQKRGL